MTQPEGRKHSNENIPEKSRRKIFWSWLFLLILAAGGCFAQEATPEPFTPKIRGAIMMANSHVPNATQGGKKISVIPTWGCDVDYYFHPRWSAAVQGDLKLQSFEIEDDNVTLERSNPFAIAAVLHYHALRYWSFYVGSGYELERHKNLFLVKAGTEYSFEINENFEIALNLIYENKEDVYDAWTFGIAFNKKLWAKARE
ncbi:MAG TPA: hypothetical protein VIU12_18150 [Chryseolinea sp.]